MLKETKCLRYILRKQEVLHTIDLDPNEKEKEHYEKESCDRA